MSRVGVDVDQLGKKPQALNVELSVDELLGEGPADKGLLHRTNIDEVWYLLDLTK
jgi:hypothetical protein